MSEIRYVCLSDVHFGASNSVLTHMTNDAGMMADPTVPSSSLVALVDCLRDVITKCNGAGGTRPTLILNGDILDLALSTTAESAMAFERFMELAFVDDRGPLFDTSMVYAPGNHDHHLWEAARDAQYAATLAQVPRNSTLPNERHTTNLFAPEPPVNIALITQLLRRFIPKANVQACYPGFGVVSADKKKCVVWSHGHYLESLYHLTTHLITMFFPEHKAPATLEALETENFAWIDFFWGTLGRSGEAGRDVSLLYDKMQDQAATKRILRTFVASVVAKNSQSRLVDWAETHVLDTLVEFALDHLAHSGRNEDGATLSDDGKQGLRAHLEGPVRGQIAAELHAVPEDVTYIFGHTHKPFVGHDTFAGFKRVGLVNSGGWVVDSLETKPLSGGAIVLVDDQLDVALLRMYNEHERAADYRVFVEADDHDSPFFARLSKLIDPASPPWNTFSQVVAKAVDSRRQALQEEVALAKELPEGGSSTCG